MLTNVHYSKTFPKYVCVIQWCLRGINKTSDTSTILHCNDITHAHAHTHTHAHTHIYIYRERGGGRESERERIRGRLYIYIYIYIFVFSYPSNCDCSASTNRFCTGNSQIAWFMGPTWGPPGSCRPQVGPMLLHELCYQRYLY